MPKQKRDDDRSSDEYPNCILCPECGKGITETDVFCPHCAVRLIVICVQCGKKMQKGLKFCPHCGTKVSNYEEKYDIDGDLRY
jgi:uncharacterized membrane protein YvbJ